MRRGKVQLVNPFETKRNDWELLTQIESSLNRYLQAPTLLSEIISKAHSEQLVNASQTLLRISETLKTQRTRQEGFQSHLSAMEQKVKQNDALISSLERNFGERAKALIEENRMLRENADKIKKGLGQAEERERKATEGLKGENEGLKKRVKQLEEQNRQMLMAVNRLQAELDEKQDKVARLLSAYSQERVVQEKDLKTQRLLTQCLLANRISGTLIAFLDPRSSTQLLSISRLIRINILKSTTCVLSALKAVVRFKDGQIKHYQAHIDYFQKMYNKIPDQIIQHAFFKACILKKPLNPHLLPVLNNAAFLFEGKFVDETEAQELFSGIVDAKAKDEPNIRRDGYLQIDQSIIEECLEEEKQSREKIMRQIDSMYRRIVATQQLYRADEETSGMFLRNVLKNFTKVFVLGKHLYAQARSLNQLNTFLLRELAGWDKMEIERSNQVQDLKAQLQAERRLKLFFTEKSMKSEQKALLEQNLKLTFEMKFQKLQEVTNKSCAENSELSKKWDEAIRQAKTLNFENVEIKRAYEHTKEKYNKVIEELSVVKETIVRMNIL